MFFSKIIRSIVAATTILVGSVIPSISQQPQSATAPLYATNAKYTNGVAPGYYPTYGTTGLVLNLGGGTVFCNGAIQQYAAGTLMMTANQTNYVYLNTSSSCVPAVKTSVFEPSDIPIAVVQAGSSSITSSVDVRTPFNNSGGGGGGGDVQTGAVGQLSYYAANGDVVSPLSVDPDLYISPETDIESTGVFSAQNGAIIFGDSNSAGVGMIGGLSWAFQICTDLNQTNCGLSNGIGVEVPGDRSGDYADRAFAGTSPYDTNNPLYIAQYTTNNIDEEADVTPPAAHKISYTSQMAAGIAQMALSINDKYFPVAQPVTQTGQAIAISGNVATVTIPNGFAVGQRLAISGCTNATYGAPFNALSYVQLSGATSTTIQFPYSSAYVVANYTDTCSFSPSNPWVLSGTWAPVDAFSSISYSTGAPQGIGYQVGNILSMSCSSINAQYQVVAVGAPTNYGVTINITSVSGGGAITGVSLAGATGSNVNGGLYAYVQGGDGTAIIQITTIPGTYTVNGVTLIYGGTTGYSTATNVETIGSGVLDTGSLKQTVIGAGCPAAGGDTISLSCSNGTASSCGSFASVSNILGPTVEETQSSGSMSLTSSVGTGYTTAGSLATTTNHSGTGAVIDINALNGGLTKAVIDSGGTGYVTGDLLFPTQSGGSGGSFSVVATNGVVVAAYVNSGIYIPITNPATGTGIVFVWYMVGPDFGGTFTLTADGGSPLVDSFQGTSTISTAYLGSDNYGAPANWGANTVQLAEFTVTGGVSHTFTIHSTNSSNGTAIVGLGVPPATRMTGISSPNVFIGGAIPEENNEQPTCGSSSVKGCATVYSQWLQQLVGQLGNSTGLRTKYCSLDNVDGISDFWDTDPINGLVNNRIANSSNGLHMASSGHRKIANDFEACVKAIPAPPTRVMATSGLITSSTLADGYQSGMYMANQYDGALQPGSSYGNREIVYSQYQVPFSPCYYDPVLWQDPTVTPSSIVCKFEFVNNGTAGQDFFDTLEEGVATSSINYGSALHIFEESVYNNGITLSVTPGSGYTSVSALTFTGGSCSVQPTGYATEVNGLINVRLLSAGYCTVAPTPIVTATGGTGFSVTASLADAATPADWEQYATYVGGGTTLAPVFAIKANFFGNAPVPPAVALEGPSTDGYLFRFNSGSGKMLIFDDSTLNVSPIWYVNNITGTPMVGASTSAIVSAPCLGTNAAGAVIAGSCPGSGGVTSINSTAGAFSFTGSGVSCSGTTCTFSGTGSGVTSFAAPSGSWPSWLVPTVTNSTSTPSLAVSASSIPNSALANPATTVNGVVCTLGSTCSISTGTTTNSLTMNDSGSGAASGSTFNGSAGETLSYNTLGAAPLASPTFTGTVTIPSGSSLGTPTSINISNGTGLSYSQLPSISANSILGALTSTTPTDLALPSCSGASNALIWTSGTGFGCNTISGGGGSGTVNSGTANELAYYPSSGTAVSSDAHLSDNGTTFTSTLPVSAPSVSLTGSGSGTIALGGSTSGTATITVQAVAGTPTITLGTGSGTPVVTATSPLSITTATGNLTLGTVPITDGGTGTASTLTGLVRGSASAMTAAELSGDCTTSGSNATTCTKTNGTSFSGYATATYVTDTTITIGSSVAFAANTCSSATGTANTASTISMTNLATSMTLQFTPTSDVHSVTGWSPGSGGQLYFQSWPSAAGTASYYVCNPTAASITTSGSVTWNVSAR